MHASDPFPARRDRRPHRHQRGGCPPARGRHLAPVPTAESLSAYLAWARRVPPLSAERQAALAARVRDRDMDAMTALLEANLRLVVEVVERERDRDRGVPLVELIHEGTIGLMHAIELFDWDAGGDFARYAAWYVRAAVALAVAGVPMLAPLPGAPTAERTADLLTRRLGREPTRAELDAQLSVPLPVLADLLQLAGGEE